MSDARASELPSPISEAFDDYITSLPWDGTAALDWSGMPLSREFNVVGKAPDEVYEWIKTARIGNRSHVAIWYSRNEGGVVAPLREGIVALDELYWDAPGPRFSFGVEIGGGVVRPFFSDLLQYGLGDLLVATV